MSGFKGRGGGWSSQKHPSSGSQGSSGPTAKKFRGDDDDDDMFDDAFDDMDDDFGGGSGQALMEEEELGQDVEKERTKSWMRPEPPVHDPGTQSLVFQQIEIDFYIGMPPCPYPIIDIIDLPEPLRGQPASW